MATLILSTVGTAVGGPVGGAIGALIGQSIDQQLLGPSTRGPRVGALKVQSSSYGAQNPRIYGSMRVAGQVIWADGKLLRGAAGDFKVSTKFRFYSGGEDQDLDPLIASVEGLTNTPAYR